MPTTGITGPNWNRGVEDRQPVYNDASLSWGAYDVSTNGEVWSGMVATVINGNEVRLANGGKFRGLFFTEKNSVLDESLGGSPPTVLVGAGLMFVRMSALDDVAAYAEGQYLTTGATAPGVLIPEGATPDPDARVAFVQEVHTDGLLIRTFNATV